MKRILVIGIGSGGMELLTVQAIEALRDTDVFFIFDKGDEKGDLARLRKEICARHCTDKPYRVVEIASPARDTDDSYKSGVAAWHAERAALAGAAIRKSLADEETGAFLVWGDPALYDSTLRVLDTIVASGDVGFDYEVIPGISSVQVLAARHRIALNAIGEPVLVTTGRKIVEAFPSDATSVVVFLDNGDGLRSLAGRKAHIYWGAYLGTDDEVLLSGPIDDVLDRILEVRADRRRAKGWIMDIYLIRACDAGDVAKLSG
jgi:precorrin-6A synthase